MNSKRYIMVAVVTAATSSGLIADDDLGDAVRAAVERVAPSVVRIRIVGVPDRAGSVGSRTTTGIVVSGQGEIVSSNFGFGGEISAILIEEQDGRRTAARMVAQDYIRKLVLLQTDNTDLIPVQWAEAPPAVGAWAIAAGRFYPTKQPSAALGIISALNRVHGIAIQTDAKVSPVNYGGPLMGLHGDVHGILVPLAPGNETVGINAGVQWYDSGIGFAVPGKDVMQTVAAIRSGDDRQRGLLGIRMSTQNPLSNSVLVKDVTAGSPAAAVGIEPGDGIIAVDGQTIDRLGLLENVLKRTAAGDSLRLRLRRGEMTREVDVRLTNELPSASRGWLGIVPLNTASIEAETPSNKPDEKEQNPQPPGVICGIMSPSPAASAGLPSVCQIKTLNAVVVRSANHLRTMLLYVRDGSDWIVEYTLPNAEDPMRQELTASPRGVDGLSGMADAVLQLRGNAAVSTNAESWQPGVSQLNDDTQMWMLAPTGKQAAMELGVIVYLPDDKPVMDELTRTWQQACIDHQLILAVVSRDNGLPVNDSRTIGMVLAAAAKKNQIDVDRVAIITESTHAQLVTQAILNPRLPPLRHGVYLNCRPDIIGTSADALQSKRPSFLMLSSDSTREQTALLTTTLNTLRNSGADAAINDIAEDNPASTIKAVTPWLWTRTIH